MKLKSKKLVLLTVLGTLAAFILSGCELVTVYGLSIHKDGTGELSVKALVDEELKGAMSADDSSSDMNPIEFEGKDYYGDEEIQEFEDFDEIVEMLEDTGVFTDVEITEDSFRLTYDDSASESDEQTQQILEGGGAVRCLLTVTFDNKITDTNGEISKDDDCTVTWDLMDLDDNELYAKVGGSSILPIILIVVGVLVVAGAVVAVILVMKNKKGKKETYDTPADTFASPYAPVAPAAPVQPVAPEQPAAPSYAPTNPVDINNTPEV